MTKERYECKTGSSFKFWEPEVRGKTLMVRYGKIGSKGQTSEKTFASKAEATRERDRLVREKIKKGYALAQNEVITSNWVDLGDISGWDGLIHITEELNKALKKGYEILGECDDVSSAVEINSGDRGQLEPSALFELIDKVYTVGKDLGADKIVAFAGRDRYCLLAVRGSVTKLQVAMEAFGWGEEDFDDEMLDGYSYFNL